MTRYEVREQERDASDWAGLEGLFKVIDTAANGEELAECHTREDADRIVAALNYYAHAGQSK